MTIVKKMCLLHSRGFTLIEFVTVILIVAIIGTMAGMALVNITGGYVLAKRSSEAAQQAQIALTRLAKELTELKSISYATDRAVTYTRPDETHTSVEEHKITWDGINQPITLDDDTLIDKVQSFSLTYYNYDYNAQTFTASDYSATTAVIELTFQLEGYEGVPLVFVERVII